MGLNKRRGSPVRKPATAPTPSKATSVLSTKHQKQATFRLQTEVTNLTLYGMTKKDILAVVSKGVDDAKAMM